MNGLPERGTRREFLSYAAGIISIALTAKFAVIDRIPQAVKKIEEEKKHPRPQINLFDRSLKDK